jgi:hypothetical protein
VFSNAIKRILAHRKKSAQIFNDVDLSHSPAEVAERSTSEPKKPEKTKNKTLGYRAEVKEKFGFDIPSSDAEKISLGRAFEKDGDLEKACACYEGCVRNRFDGNAPYDRLIVIYKRLGRPKDVERVIRKAMAVFEKVANRGRSDGLKKFEKFKLQLEEIDQR